jgi:hypothetical protein
VETWFNTGGDVCFRRPKPGRMGVQRWQGMGENRAKKRGDKPVKHTGQAGTKEFASWMAHPLVHSPATDRTCSVHGFTAQSFREPSQRDWETHSR